jgi:WD40 repeat protein
VDLVTIRTLVCDLASGMLKILDIDSGEFLVTINKHTDSVGDILLISNDRFVTCSGDNTIKLFDLNSYECI